MARSGALLSGIFDVGNVGLRAAGAATLLLACAHGGHPQERSQFEQSLVSAVIIQTIDRLPGAADSAYLATAPTPDSARVLFRSMWASWWHRPRQIT
jgi:hypothetical protein